MAPIEILKKWRVGMCLGMIRWRDEMYPRGGKLLVPSGVPTWRSTFQRWPREPPCGKLGFLIPPLMPSHRLFTCFGLFQCWKNTIAIGPVLMEEQKLATFLSSCSRSPIIWFAYFGMQKSFKARVHCTMLQESNLLINVSLRLCKEVI